MGIKKGDKVKIEYKGSFDDGSVFDSSEKHGKPLEFVAGEGMVIAGFDEAVSGMNIGDEKEISLKPSEAYGEKDDRAIQEVPKTMMPEGIKEGLEIGVPLENGQTLPAKITKISDEKVTIDMNHPLAGKNLHFKLKVIGIE